MGESLNPQESAINSARRLGNQVKHILCRFCITSQPEAVLLCFEHPVHDLEQMASAQILTFDKTSSAKTAKFEDVDVSGLFKRLSGDLYSSAGPEYMSYGTLHKKFKNLRDLTTSNKYLYDYFNTADKINLPTTWVFGAKNDVVRIEQNFSLYDLVDNNQVYKGTHSYKADTFNLGKGSDYFRLSVDVGAYSDPNAWSSNLYASFQDQLLDGGVRVSVNGQEGADRIDLSLYQCDYECNKNGSITPVMPVALINIGSNATNNYGAGNDEISVSGMSANIDGGDGADIITGSQFSDMIKGGKGNDHFKMSNGDYAESHTEWSYILNERDLLYGGEGKNTFTFGLSNQYTRNGGNDYAVIADLKPVDRLVFVFSRGDLLIDNSRGTLKLPASNIAPNGANNGAMIYGQQNISYASRIYLDSDGNGSLDPKVDDLLLYANAPISSTQLIYVV